MNQVGRSDGKILKGTTKLISFLQRIESLLIALVRRWRRKRSSLCTKSVQRRRKIRVLLSAANRFGDSLFYLRLKVVMRCSNPNPVIHIHNSIFLFFCLFCYQKILKYIYLWLMVWMSCRGRYRSKLLDDIFLFFCY